MTAAGQRLIADARQARKDLADERRSLVDDCSRPVATVRVRLPFPISVNGMFAKHNGAHLSERYRAWRDEAGWLLKSQKPVRIAGPVCLRIDLKAPDRRHRDCANYEKGVTDLLVMHGVIDGDDERTVRRVSIGWEDEASDPCSVIVTAWDRRASNGNPP